MKQIMLFVFIVIGAMTAGAQKLTEAQVPPVVKTTFSKAHPNTVGKWEQEGAAYEVDFNENEKTMSCVIDKNGTLQETETAINVSELPASIKTYVAQRYKGAVIKEAAQIITANGEILYEANVRGKDLLFTEGGNLVKVNKE